MLEDSITDFRHVIEEKLKLKESALDQTEQHLKKFSILRENNGFNSNGPPISRNNDRNMGKQQQRGSIRGRLGPPANSRPSMESRLGPKVQENDSAADQDPFQEETRSVLSRVVVEQQKSRDEALAEEDQKMDKKEKQVSFNLGSFTNNVDKFLPFFDHLSYPPPITFSTLYTLKMFLKPSHTGFKNIFNTH